MAFRSRAGESRSGPRKPQAVRLELVETGFVRRSEAVKVRPTGIDSSVHRGWFLAARAETLVILGASLSTLFLAGWIADLALYWYDVGILANYEMYRVQVAEAWAVAVGASILTFLALSHYTRLKREGVP